MCEVWGSAHPIAHGAAQLCWKDRKRPRPADVIDVEELESDNDDDCQLIASSEARVFQPQEARKKPLSYPTQQQCIIPLAQLAAPEAVSAGVGYQWIWEQLPLVQCAARNSPALCDPAVQQRGREAE